MTRSLRLVHPVEVPASLGDARISVRFALEDGDRLTADFSVRAARLSFNRDFPSQGSHWGLWDWDVVELFVSTGGSDYYEFQVSPLDQAFELRIFEPRKRFDKEFRCAWTHASSVSGEAGAYEWNARMSLPLRELGWGGDVTAIRGGAFAILGAAGERGYWSLFLPPQEKPDFHLPSCFGSLL